MTTAKSPTDPQPLNSSGLDRAAVLLSGLCLVHCLAIPFALLLGPLFGHWLINSDTEVHWVLLAVAIPISALALWRGYVKHHNLLTITLGSGGLVFMFIGVSHIFGEEWETGLTVIGVCALLIAHVRNMLGTHAHA